MSGKKEENRTSNRKPGPLYLEELHKQAEAILRNQDARLPVNRRPDSATDPEQTLHELRVHQVELEMQNEELRRVQGELDLSQARYFDLFNRAPAGYCILNNKGLILEINLTCLALLGVQREHLIRQPFTRCIFQADQDVQYLHFKKLQETGEPQTYELRLAKPDGRTFWAHLAATTVKGADGETTCRITMTDITERKQIEEIQLFLAQTSSGQSDQSFFHSLARFLGEKLQMDFVCIDRLEGDGLNARTVAVWCDGIFEDNVTYALKDTPCGEVVGKTVCCFAAGVCQAFPQDKVLKDLRAESYAGVTLWSHTGEPIGLIAVISRRSLVNRPLTETTLKLISGRAAGELERLDAEAERGGLATRLQQAEKMESVGRLAGGIAHDFNNMLGVILGHTEIALDDTDQNSPLYASLVQIRKAAEHSADLTGRLLAFARKQVVSPKVLDLNETVGGMLKMLQRLIGEDIELTWKPGNDLWPVKVDPSQIDQILANLCVNARDAVAGVGKLTIEVTNITISGSGSAPDDPVPGDYVGLAVSDTGCGMSAKTLAHLFEPFFTTKEVGKGTGLGLAMVYGAVKQNNGFIHVHSKVGSGTTFSIYLPRHSGQAVPEPTPTLAEPGIGRQATILLVEDETTLLELSTLMLEKQGYTVLAAATPVQAMQFAHKYAGKINLLLTDVVMPGMNGRDLTKSLRSLYPHLKCMYMSGYPDHVIAQQGILDEGVSFIQKPFSRKNLIARVAEALQKEA